MACCACLPTRMAAMLTGSEAVKMLWYEAASMLINSLQHESRSLLTGLLLG